MLTTERATVLHMRNGTTRKYPLTRNASMLVITERNILVISEDGESKIQQDDVKSITFEGTT